MFEKDEIFVPKQTSWFWYYPDGSFTTLSPDQKMTQTGSKRSESGASNESIPYTSSPSEVEVDVDTSNKRKTMEPRANYWMHFEKFTDENGASKAKCKYCAKAYVASTSSNASVPSTSTRPQL
ncbi:uncharacterized protein LOC114076808 [Solanum pennellii]|uniref:Uncharacterized protein LOC114076808 n=1 Tax=Solanum pennellii TaxID=28526 RepID=A0ABM1V8T7_SOLPN|nr:uncharacterized protein LOC114076808 [Solanum pennellii]